MTAKQMSSLAARWVDHEAPALCMTDEFQARGLRNQNFPTKAKLTYFQDKSLSLQLQYKSEDTWTDCFSVTATPEQPLKLPTVAYLGFTAETGELSDNFDIIEVETRNLYLPTTSQRRPDSFQRGRGRKSQKKSGSWTWFLVKFVFFGTVCAGGGYFGWTMYRANKRTRF